MKTDIEKNAISEVWAQRTGGPVYFQPTQPIMLIEKHGTGISRIARSCGYGRS